MTGYWFWCLRGDWYLKQEKTAPAVLFTFNIAASSSPTLTTITQEYLPQNKYCILPQKQHRMMLYRDSSCSQRFPKMAHMFLQWKTTYCVQKTKQKIIGQMDPLVQKTNHNSRLLNLDRENHLQPWRVHIENSVILREQNVNFFLKLSPKKEAATSFKATILDGKWQPTVHPLWLFDGWG